MIRFYAVFLWVKILLLLLLSRQLALPRAEVETNLIHSLLLLYEIPPLK
ncbi:hypothetical protein VAE151_550475 [Vibrio aestuarianus]|nr:hypothetical protein VAE151_550475 [Vibrio aestuarianus]